MYEIIALWILTFILAIIVHEFGHLLYALSLRQRVHLKLFKVTMVPSRSLSKKESLYFYLSGIMIGLIPIAVGSIGEGAVYFILLLLFYVVGCNKDIKRMIGIWRDSYG